ncbi:DUF3047 domain-containing protein [Limnohabitans sp. T6-20]|uniref:DUF3047 domain-containing protein n=1 Tax=Limnohabitans sp. T6-20 TaxID=1100725 RepID=UPI000D34D736|nr:DUF3047 domain-containing protein [Limnohabitans sp. T6-20]PUE12150.1 hypothetical protein B9Z33_00890 [Limnohabitans sp. T6-20]
MVVRCVRSRFFWGALLAFGLSGCAWRQDGLQTNAVLTKPVDAPLLFSPQDTLRWTPVLLPSKLRTAFQLEKHDQRIAVKADAQSSASMLRQKLNVPADRLGRLQFQWQIEGLIAQADMGERDSEDSPVRLILAFEGDRSRFSAKNAMLSDLTEALTGEPLPYATLMYVWCNHRPVESVIVNPRTDRVRKLVMESGAAHIKQWRHYERDVRADFEKAFGEPPGALVGIAIMTDTDNTRSHAKAWYGDIRLD